MPSFTLVPHKVSTRITDPIVSPLAAAGVTPNMISVAGFSGNVAAGVLAASGEFLLAGIVMLIASALDLLDGALARKTNTVSRFGAVFDSVLDRLSEAAVLGGLLYHFQEVGGHTQETVLCFAAIVGSLMVSYVRARAEGEGLQLREGLFTRAERVILLGGALVIGVDEVLLAALWVLAVLSHVTAAQRVFTVWQKLYRQAPE
ncbi:MAG TPA: CDP-alcohol phosphatidyltransferase family protein [Dehalococcoidia bacterium]|nr:CDP-alcohol phosphatidyltransferase family protein [Dehalococcoidia bacterium]